MNPAATPTSGAASYATAALPEPFRILGLRLRPFSLGHYLLLQRFGCACLNEPEPGAPPAVIPRADLILGVLICSMRHQEFLQFIEQKNFTREVRRWGQRAGLFELQPKSDLFRQYLAASLTEPDYIPLRPGDDTGDWAQSLKLTLVTRLNHSEAEALDMPLSQALADYFKLAENEGLLRLLTPEDRAMAEANSAALAQLAAEPKTEAPCPA